jgi:hypothetical protein
VFNAKIMDNDVRKNSQHPVTRASRPSCNSPLNAHPATPALLSWCFSSPEDGSATLSEFFIHSPWKGREK